MTVWSAIYIMWSIAGAIWVIARGGNPAATWGWVAFMIVLPPAATLLRLLTADRPTPPRTPCREYRTRLQNCIRTCCGAALATHNRVQTLHNAKRTFSAIIRDMQHARESIDIEYYIISDDRIGRTIARILMRRARAGVRVRIIYDALGSWRLGKRLLRDMHGQGIATVPYGRLRFPYLTPSVHRRNHRKLIVVDGRTAYLGGINIASRYIDGGKMGFWRDEHIRIEGDAAVQAQSLFDADWRAAGGHGPLPPAAPSAPQPHSIATVLPIQIAWAQPGPARRTLEHAFTEAIASARDAIRISTPYFLPPPTLLDAICSAARSGIKVELLLPMSADIPIIGHAAGAYIRECVEAGVAVYRYRNGFLHSKTIVIDDRIAAVGSANLDYRSLCYNLETVAFIYSRAVAADYISKFCADTAISERVTPQWLATRSCGTQLAESFARLLAPLL